jgi:hypothetical protein
MKYLLAPTLFLWLAVATFAQTSPQLPGLDITLIQGMTPAEAQALFPETYKFTKSPMTDGNGEMLETYVSAGGYNYDLLLAFDNGLLAGISFRVTDDSHFYKWFRAQAEALPGVEYQHSTMPNSDIDVASWKGMFLRYSIMSEVTGVVTQVYQISWE